MKPGDHSSGATPSDDFALDPLRIIDPINFEGSPVPVRRWLLDDWIPLRAVTAIYGDGGVGKSLLAQQLMTSCASGALFLGMPVMRCRTLGIFCEDDEDELHRRQAAINHKLDLDWADLDGMRWLSRVGSENLLMTFAADGRGVLTPFHAQIVSAAKEIGAQLVVIDTAADTFGGNENIRPQVRQFISSGLTQIACEIDGALLLLAHPSQSGRDSGRGDGASTAWSNSVRARGYFRKVDGAEADPNLRVLSRAKANYAQSGAEITVAYEDGAFVRRDRGGAQHGFYRAAEAEQAFMAGMSELKGMGLRVNVHKGQANFAPKQMVSVSKTASGFSENELTSAMHRLLKNARIRSVEDGPQSRRRTHLEITPELGLDEPPASNVVALRAGALPEDLGSGAS
jgi:RecA-family ATPase